MPRPLAGDFERIYDPSVGERESWYINDHTFFRGRDGTWHLIGITHAEPMAPFDEVDFGHATAQNLRGPWTKQHHALSASIAAGEHHLWAPHVIHHEDLFWMFYCAGGPSPQEYRIHLATSEDGWKWHRHPANPLIVDGYEARDPMVVWIDGRWIMYYTATESPAGGHHIVAAAESTDLARWEGRHIVYRDQLQGTLGGPTESPFVVECDGEFHLFIGPDWEKLTAALDAGNDDPAAYRRTRVFESSNPLSFDLDGQIATIDAHAAEVIVDLDGSYWVSHCGWGQGGIYLAPLFWS
ncbi:MAG: family 43 glycosylhydrolase [Actinobacteria bacterium]|nr:family 43 glycosylhydrolase [Actinomycetota bacterium]